MGCITKLGLFVLNFAIFAAGVAVVTLASIIISKDNSYGEMLVQSGVFTLPIIILIAGLVIVVIGFLGCCGAMKESSCMLKTYAVIVTLLLLGEITLGILLLVYPQQAQNIIKNEMLDTFQNYGKNDPSLDKTIDSMQHDLECCGVNDYNDWKNITWGHGHNVSQGCCKDMEEDCGMNIFDMTPSQITDTIYTRGCYEALKEDLQSETIALGVVLFLMAIVQVMAVSCACGLSRKSSHYA